MPDALPVFAEKLHELLRQPLPGAAAQYRMAPAGRKEQAVQPKATARQSGVLILFYPEKAGISLPLILRPQYKGVHSGQIAFPGGRLEQQDEDLTATALREAEEEIGVPQEQVEVVGLLTPLYIPPSNFHVQPVVGITRETPQFQPQVREVEKIVKVSLRQLLQKEIEYSSRITTSTGAEMQVPSYQIQGHTVWGATAMVLSELLMLLEAAYPPGK